MTSVLHPFCTKAEIPLNKFIEQGMKESSTFCFAGKETMLLSFDLPTCKKNEARVKQK